MSLALVHKHGRVLKTPRHICLTNRKSNQSRMNLPKFPIPRNACIWKITSHLSLSSFPILLVFRRGDFLDCLSDASRRRKFSAPQSRPFCRRHLRFSFSLRNKTAVARALGHERAGGRAEKSLFYWFHGRVNSSMITSRANPLLEVVRRQLMDLVLRRVSDIDIYGWVLVYWEPIAASALIRSLLLYFINCRWIRLLMWYKIIINISVLFILVFRKM